MACISCLCGRNVFSLLFNVERKFFTLCPFVSLHCFLLLNALSFCFFSLTVILLIVSENPGAVRSDLLPPRAPLPLHAHAHLQPVPHPQQPHTHPAGAGRPVSQQAFLLHLFLLLPSLLLRLLPGFLAQLPALPLQLGQPRLPPLLPSTVPAALLALPRSAAAHFLTTLHHYGGSSDWLRLWGHPGVRGHGVPSHGAPVCPLPLPSTPAPADNGEPAGRQ